MSTRHYHLGEQEIPEGFQIFEERLEVAGVSFRKEDAAAFAASKHGWLELEREPRNIHDPNAIKIIGCSKSFLGTKRRFIGYMPRDVSRAIVDGGHLSYIRPRLLKTYVGDRGFVEILFQILGSKGKQHEFRRASVEKPPEKLTARTEVRRPPSKVARSTGKFLGRLVGRLLK